MSSLHTSRFSGRRRPARLANGLVHALVIGASLVAVLSVSSDAFAQPPRRSRGKLDSELTRRQSLGTNSRRSRILVELGEGQELPTGLRRYQKGSRLGLINGYVLDVPDSALGQVGLIRFGGHLPYEGYDVQTDGRHSTAAR